jgi:hypothetical protein
MVTLGGCRLGQRVGSASQGLVSLRVFYAERLDQSTAWAARRRHWWPGTTVSPREGIKRGPSPSTVSDHRLARQVATSASPIEAMMGIVHKRAREVKKRCNPSS